MKTSKPISTICYLDAALLRKRLETINAEHPNVIRNYAFVEHLPEKEGLKAHIHVYLELGTTLDTDLRWFKDAFSTYFGEDYDSMEWVSAVKPWTTSKVDDWFLYSMHNATYLKRKGLVRKYHYFKDNFSTNDLEWLDEQWDMALAKVQSCAEKLESCIREGLNLFQSMAVCGVSYGAMKSFAETYNLMKQFFMAESED